MLYTLMYLCCLRSGSRVQVLTHCCAATELQQLRSTSSWRHGCVDVKRSALLRISLCAAQLLQLCCSSVAALLQLSLDSVRSAARYKAEANAQFQRQRSGASEAYAQHCLTHRFTA